MEENKFEKRIESREGEPRHYKIFHVDTVYGVGDDNHVEKDVDIIVNPEGLIESIEPKGSKKLGDNKLTNAVESTHEVIMPAIRVNGAVLGSADGCGILSKRKCEYATISCIWFANG